VDQPQPEFRKPNSEARKKSRNPNFGGPGHKQLKFSGFGFHSDFGFEFRVSK